MRLLSLPRRFAALAAALCAAVLCATAAHAQGGDHTQSDATGGRVVLVLPFDNRSGQPSLDWIGESFAETISDRMRSAGFLTISRDDRVYALDHLGLPTGFRPSRATTIRIAQTLDAQFVLVGSFTVKDSSVTAQVQVLEVNHLTMTQPIEQTAALADLIKLESGIAWHAAKKMDNTFAVAENTFLAASSGLKLDAYESYIRGVTATTDDERVKRLKTAVSLSPANTGALLALGKTDYTDGNYEDAAAVLAKVPPTDERALEAGFYLGLSRFNTARYAEAENAFAAVAGKLPLPEVVNNRGVALARQHKNGVVYMQQAAAADPLDADYHFNLAVALRRNGEIQHARTEIEQAVKLRPNDAEAKDLQAALIAGRPSSNGFDPQERIRRTYSEAAFRQAAFQIDQLRAMRIASLPQAQQATEYTQAGRDYLAQGLVLEAERQFQAALQADPGSSAAHLGLAEVRERSGNPDEARREAQTSLGAKPTAAAYLALARVDMGANQVEAAASDVGNALRLEPANSAALAMKSAILARGVSIP